MPQNIFKIYGGRTHFQQWDRGQKLIVLDDTIDEVHFSNKDMNHSISREVLTDITGTRYCHVPDNILTLPKNLIAHAYVIEDGQYQTSRAVKFAVSPRPIPNDYISDQDSQLPELEHKVAKLEELIEKGGVGIQKFNTIEEAKAWAQASSKVGAVVAININSKWVAHMIEDDYNVTPICGCGDNLENQIDSLEAEIATLKGTGDGSVQKTVNDALDEFASKVSNDGVINSYKELIDYASTHGGEFTTLVGKVDTNTKEIVDVKGSNDTAIKKVQNDISALNTKIGNKSVAEQISEAIAELVKLNKIQEMIDAVKPKVTTITLKAASWIGYEAPYYQDVALNFVTENSKIDIQPTGDQLSEWQSEGLAFSTLSQDGYVRVYVTDVKPADDISVQITVQEVVMV